MEEGYIEESVRTRLILTGITELEEHGITDFSLRRAALAAQVSCAAPYRHFKDKDEYIREIISYVNSKWELLSHEIERIYGDNPPRLAVEICMASMRFRLANKNFSTVFTLAARNAEGSSVDSSVRNAIALYSSYRSLSASESLMKEYTALALVSWTVIMSVDGGMDVLSLAREKLESEFL